MQPIPEFQQAKPEFWALVKLVSRQVGYTHRRKSKREPLQLRRYSTDEVKDALERRSLDASAADIAAVVAYVGKRADLLDRDVEPNLMRATAAKREFQRLRKSLKPPDALLPMNRQGGKGRHPLYLTGIVNMLAYRGLRGTPADFGFDANPGSPLTFARQGRPLRTLFRRMDGAYPNVNQPVAAWEIKEYYGTTTFGSRVADGVYETALDGYELNELRAKAVEVKHYLFLDDYFTWWECGPSYLCRIVDMLHVGLLDEAIVGKEVLTRWPEIVKGWRAATT